MMARPGTNFAKARLPFLGARPPMSTIWLTYAWHDNRDGDVDILAQQLLGAGITVKLDPWNIQAGRHLWEQIANFIANPAQSDAWILLATPASLGSAACKEELAFALNRTLHTRGAAFPIIGLFNTSVDRSILPASFRVRHCVSTTDPDWKERIKSAAEERAFDSSAFAPYQLLLYQNVQNRAYVIEIRPSAETWSPFVVAVPIAEKIAVNPSIQHGPAGMPPGGSVLIRSGACESNDRQWWSLFAQNEATPTQSYYLYVDQKPTQIAFGVNGGQPIYNVEIPR
jgi:hypothetical protein